MSARLTIMLIVYLSVSINYTSYCQLEIIEIPFGNSVVINGEIEPLEWVDSDTIILNGSSSNEVSVIYKHDSKNIFFAFLGNLQSNNRMPEILFDIDDDKNSSWKSDDWWFHVSATDCEYQGEYGNYQNCQLKRPNWLAEPNMMPGPNPSSFVDTIEIAIPFSTLNIDINTIGTIGISVCVTNLFSSWSHWPENSNRNIPETWGSASFELPQKTNISYDDYDKVSDYYDYELFDLNGNKLSIDTELNAGVYIRVYKDNFDNPIKSEKIIIMK